MSGTGCQGMAENVTQGEQFAEPHVRFVNHVVIVLLESVQWLRRHRR